MTLVTKQFPWVNLQLVSFDGGEEMFSVALVHTVFKRLSFVQVCFYSTP